MTNPDVFISYAAADRAAADAACRALEGAGIPCWIAPRDVVPGEIYAESIVRGIDAAKLFVLVLSQHSAASPHVLREVERATSKRLNVLSLRIDQVALPPALEYFLNASHWLEAMASGIQAVLPRLVDAAARLCAPGAVAGAVADAVAPDATRPRPDAGGATTAGANSIAVLPFANMSADPDQEFFSDGLAEEIITLLAQVAGLKVIARTSAFAFRGRDQDIRQIAGILGVTHVLEGSVRRAGNRLRITAQLVQAEDGSHLWTERFDRELSDVFAVQDEISAAIVGALRGRLSVRPAPARYAPGQAAYDAYLRARHHQAAVTPESIERAMQCYREAIRLDPAFGLAYVGIAACWIAAMIFGRHATAVAVQAARAEVHRALQFDPSLPEGHALLGILAAMYEMDWATAERHFEHPLARQAGVATLRPLYGWFQFLRGNFAAAIALAQRSIDSDPLDVWPRMNLQAYLQAADRPGEALEQLRKVLELDENQVVAMAAMALILVDRGELDAALATARRAHAIAPWYADATALLAGLLQRQGDVAAAEALVSSLDSGEAIGAAHVWSLYYLVSGDVERGADWAERAIGQRDQVILIYLRFVVARPLRDSGRWPRILQRIGLA